MNILKKLQRLFIKNDIDNSVNKDEWIDEYGVTYSADKKRLIKGNYKQKEYRIIEGCEIIGDSAFFVERYDTHNSVIQSIIIPYSVITIEHRAFANNRNLTKITIGNSITSIGEFAFSYCSSLANVIIPDSVTSIGYRAFSECYNLRSIILGNSVTSIGDNIFRFCYELAEIHFKNPMPNIDNVSSIDPDLIHFCNRKKTKCKLYVPKGSKEAYQKAWGFENIIEE